MTFTRRCATLALATVAAGLLLPIFSASAANVLWSTNSSGLFDEGANWSSGAMPGSVDNAIFSRGAGVTYDVSFFGSFNPATANYLVDQWRVRSNNVTFKRALSAASLTAGNPSTGLYDRGIIVGETPDDLSSVTSFLNTLTAGAASIATGDRSTATLRLAGSNLNLTGSSGNPELLVGHNGNGTLDLLGSAVTLSGFNGDARLGENAGSSGTLSVGFGSTFSAPQLYIGWVGSGTLNVSGGGQVMSPLVAYLGWIGTAHGAATIQGAGAMWSTGELIVGGVGMGSLSIAEGGVVTFGNATLGAGGGTGSASVHGAGSRWTGQQGLNVGPLAHTGLTVGKSGNGSVTVAAGGQINVYEASIGHSNNGNGAVTVDGVGSALTVVGALSVGWLGNSQGTLNISGGGAVQSGDAHLGIAGPASGTVTVGGGGGISTWNIDGELLVSETGRGSLHLLSGGRVTHGEAAININGRVTVEGAGAVLSSDDAIDVFGRLRIAAGGNAFHGRANVTSGNPVDAATVDGAGSAWTVTELVVGADRLGTLNVTGGGQVTDSFAFVGDAAGGSGVVNVGGASTWTPTGELTIGAVGAGTLNITGGGQVESGDAEVGARFGSAGVVNLSGAGSAWTIDGHLKLTGGGDSTLAFGLSAATGNGLITADSAALDGALQVSLLDGFSLRPGDEFEILNVAGARTGQFAGLGEGALVGAFGGTDLFISYAAGNGNDVALFTAAEGLPGDYNHNGIVDAADYTVWRDGLGGQYTQTDYNVWQQNFGRAGSSSTQAGSAAIPEPASWLLLAIAGLKLATARRKT